MSNDQSSAEGINDVLVVGMENESVDDLTCGERLDCGGELTLETDDSL